MTIDTLGDGITFSVQHRAGTSHANADALSRLCHETKSKTDDELAPQLLTLTVRAICTNFDAVEQLNPDAKSF